MSAATIWTAGKESVLAFTANFVAEQAFIIAVQGQTLFNLDNFSYAVGQNALKVYVNGVRQTVGRDFLESSSTSFSLTSGVDVGDTVLAEAYSVEVNNSVDIELRADLTNNTDPLKGAEIVGVALPVPRTLFFWIKQQVAIAENYPSIQAAANSGRPILKISEPAHTFTSTVDIPVGVTVEGNGKSDTAITCATNIPAFRLRSVNDAAIEGVLIIASSVAGTPHTQPMILLDADSSTMARCRIRDVQGSGFGTDFPFISILTRNGAFGSWAHLISDVSVSGCGTIIRAETLAANSWINSIQLSHIHANDFIRGFHAIATAGDGASDMTIFDWATQTSARTQFGALLQDVPAKGISRKNTFKDVRFYDLQPSALAYYIGNNVWDTRIDGLDVDDLIPSRIRDLGISTTISGKSLFDYISREGLEGSLSTATNLTSGVVGTGTTQTNSQYIQLRTGTGSNSVARVFSDQPVSGLSKQQIFSIDFGKPFSMSFALTRIGVAAGAVGRVQIKSTQADGAFSSTGLGLLIHNLSLFGDSFGAAAGTVHLGAVANEQTNIIEINHYPGVRIEYKVNGVLASEQNNLAAIPAIQQACYLQASLANNSAADAQMFAGNFKFKAAL